ncbi:MAG: Ppx/GppA family phosphatase [Syntrophomonadaceae bacterium]|nr:Ppx/GppA family phosphatase [Syntrophomonadaceae bacterium]
MASIGIIDIGSNSMRLVLFETGDQGNFQIINDLKESVRLEEGMLETRDITAEKIDQAIEVLLMFKAMCTSNNVQEIIAIGTQAVRNANNREQFVQRVMEETGLSLQILSGEEEAYLDYVGVVRSMITDDCLIMDMGGGSTEFIWSRNGEMVNSISIPLGSINLTRRFGLHDEISDNQIQALHDYLQKSFDAVPWLRNNTARTLVGIGGSIRNIGKIDRRRKNYPLDLNHNYYLAKTDVEHIVKQLTGTNLIGRKGIKGLAGDRADIIVAPALTLAFIMNYCRLDNMVVSGNGLREGFVFNHMGGDLRQKDNPLDFSIYNNLHNYKLNIRHAEHVFRLSQTLFKQLQPLHNLGQETEIVLKTAAFLHHSGLNIRYYNYHEHSFYMILNCGLMGLTHRELLLSAYVAAAHNKDNYKVDVYRYQPLLNPEDVTVIHKLGLLIRIAEGLDRSMNSNTADIQCSILKDAVVIKTIAAVSNSLEINEALKSSTYFKKLFRRQLIIV